MSGDVIVKVYADVEGQTLDGAVLTPPDATYTDTLKYSHAVNCAATGCDITGGREDCVDINRLCQNITIKDSILRISGNQAVTIKGGSSGISLENVVIHGAGKYAEIELGNWSDQSMAKTTGVLLHNVSRADGKPVRVVVGVADKPLIIGGNCVINQKWSLLVKLYCMLKGWGLIK